MAPKQKRPYGQSDEKREDDPIRVISTLDPDFDELDQAGAEFTQWRWPGRTE